MNNVWRLEANYNGIKSVNDGAGIRTLILILLLIVVFAIIL